VLNQFNHATHLSTLTQLAGFALTLKRVMLENVGLSPPTAAGGLPVLLPLGMFSTAPSKLRMVDVRLMVSQDVFSSYLAFFSKELDATQLTAEGGSITMYTVSGKSRWICSTTMYR
jgi:hypothetical protein